MLYGSVVTSHGLWQIPVGGLYQPANDEAPIAPLGDPREMGKVCGLNSPFQSNFSVSLTISEPLGIRSTNLICWIIDCHGTYDLC